MYSEFRGFLAENGIKHKWVADLIGVTPACFSQKMRGITPFSVEQIRKICQKYGISADQYFFKQKVS